MARLPQPGGDNGDWGDILNDFLSQAHNDDGTLKNDIVATSQLSAGAVTLEKIDPQANIPKTLLDQSVQDSLTKADNAPAAPTGTPDGTKFLRDDNTWAVVTQQAPAGVTRSAAYCFEMCSLPIVQSNANTPFHLRRPFRLAVKPTRFRVRVRNRVQLSASSPTGSVGQIQNLTIVIGKPAVDPTTGDLNGNWTSAPTMVMPAANMAAGTEAVSGWVNATDYPINIDEIHMLGYSFLSANVPNGQVVVNGGLSFQNQTPSDLTVVSPATALTRADNNAWLQVVIEYEHTDQYAKQLLVIGNSLSGPSANFGASPLPLTNFGEMGTWHQKWATSNRCIASSIAVAGAYSANYTTTFGADRWDIFDGFNIPYVPDAILYFAAASSDIADCTSSSTSNDVKTNVRNMIRKGRAKYPTVTRHILTNIPPRNNFSGSNTSNTTNEYWRNDINNWMDNTLPMQVERCIDLDSIVTDWANPARLRPVYTTEGVHFTARAHDLVSQAVPVRRDA